MRSLAIHAVGDSCGVRLVGIDADQVDCGAMQPQIDYVLPVHRSAFRSRSPAFGLTGFEPATT